MHIPSNDNWRDEIIHAALLAADPKIAIKKLFLSDENEDLRPSHLVNKGYARFHVISIGKAAIAMTAGLIALYDEAISGGIMIPKASFEINPEDWHTRFKIIPSAHPIPDERSCKAGEAILDYLSNLNENDFVFYLISGGGSSLVTLPEGTITLEDLKILNQSLLKSGATINEINCLRKHVDKIKGGKLINQTNPAGFCTLILSDVIGDPLDVIASGPTVYDPGTFQEALQILHKYELTEKIPLAISDYLIAGKAGLQDETPKADHMIPGYQQPIIIGSNFNSLQSASEAARASGMKAVILTDKLTGEAQTAANWVVNTVKLYLQAHPDEQTLMCFLCGGETTVTIHGNGLGGRNLELALSAVEPLAGIKNSYFVTFATDGEDGPTDAAGAWVSADTAEKALKKGLIVTDFLARNDSYTFFKQMDQLIITGSTGTNVNDICFLIVNP